MKQQMLWDTQVDNHTLALAGVKLNQYSDSQLYRMRNCLRERMEQACSRESAIAGFRRDFNNVIKLGKNPRAFLKKQIHTAMMASRCAETDLFLACMKTAIDDLFNSDDRAAEDAFRYFMGYSSFMLHCSFLEMNGAWVKKCVVDALIAADKLTRFKEVRL